MSPPLNNNGAKQQFYLPSDIQRLSSLDNFQLPAANLCPLGSAAISAHTIQIFHPIQRTHGRERRGIITATHQNKTPKNID